MRIRILSSIAVAVALLAICLSPVMASDGNPSVTPACDWNGSFIQNTEHKENAAGRIEIHTPQDLVDIVMNDPTLTGEYIQMDNISFDNFNGNGGFTVSVTIDRSVAGKISFSFREGSNLITDKIYVWLGEEVKDTVTGTVEFDIVDTEVQRTMAAGGMMTSKGPGEYMAISVDIVEESGQVERDSNGNFAPIGTKATPFKGKYDGNGYTITGLETSAFSDVLADVFSGLFGNVVDADIENVGLEGGCSTALSGLGLSGGSAYGGAIAGMMSGSASNILMNCYNTGNVTACGYLVMVGGIVGQLSGYANLEASYCHNGGNITGINSYWNNNICVGGLFGWLDNHFTMYVYNTGNVTAVAAGAQISVGGVAGYSQWILMGGYNTGEVFAYSMDSKHIVAGGLAGYTYYGYYLYNTGNVKVVCEINRSESYSSAHVGGISGNPIAVVNCYNTGHVELIEPGDPADLHVGGLAGTNYGTWVDHMYYSYSLEGTAFLNGVLVDTIGDFDPSLIDEGYTGAKGSGLRTMDQLKDISNYCSAEEDIKYGWFFSGDDQMWEIIPEVNGGLPFITELVPIAITDHPVDCSADCDTIADFLAGAAHRDDAYYLWQIDRGSGWETVGSGSSYSHTASSADNGAKIRCVVYNEHGAAVSRSAVLTVTGDITAPFIPANDGYGGWWIWLLVGAFLLILLFAVLNMNRGYKVVFTEGISGRHRARKGKNYVFKSTRLGNVQYSNDKGATWKSPVHENGEYLIPEEDIIDDIEIKFS